MNAKARYFHIDILRANAILLMIVTHVLSWHLGERGILQFWNAIHFVVVGLVFCSAYLYAKSNPDDTIHHRFGWFLKRVMRLYVPFVIYLAVHYTLWYLFPWLIRGYGIKKSLPFVIASVDLTGGVDIGWLTTLFVQLAVVFPFLLPLIRGKKTRIPVLSGLILYSTLTAIFRIPTNYTRLTGWFPWSLIAAIAFLYNDAEQAGKKKLIKLTVIIFSASLIACALSFRFLSLISRPLMFTDHKYPPDIYYLAYGLTLTSFYLIVRPVVENILFPIQKLVTFVSRESYTIFFVHMIVLDAVMTTMPSSWIGESGTIIIVSLVITAAFGKAAKILSSVRKANSAV